MSTQLQVYFPRSEPGGVLESSKQCNHKCDLRCAGSKEAIAGSLPKKTLVKKYMAEK